MENCKAGIRASLFVGSQRPSERVGNNIRAMARLYICLAQSHARFNGLGEG